MATMKADPGLIAILNTLLGTYYVFFIKLRNYHWNVTGPLFADLHEQFQSQYDAIDLMGDEVAELIRQYQGVPLGSMKEFLEVSIVQDVPGALVASRQMVSSLVADHEAIINWLDIAQEKALSEYDCVTTNNFLVGLMEKHSKMAWLLRATLES